MKFVKFSNSIKSSANLIIRMNRFIFSIAEQRKPIKGREYEKDLPHWVKIGNLQKGVKISQE